jgi:hypothetical protein
LPGLNSAAPLWMRRCDALNELTFNSSLT